MNQQLHMDLSRRERQIMDIIYRRGQATVAEVLADMPDSPSYSTIRALMRVMTEKGHLKHQQQGQRYVFMPTADRENVKHSALKRLLHTFFDNSIENAVTALLSISKDRLTKAELDQLQKLIEQARLEGR